MSKNPTKNAKPAAEAADAPAAKPLPKGHYNIQNVPLANIVVKKGFNPRTVLGDITELKKAIRTYGIVSPITVAPKSAGSDSYYIIAGHRRHAAAVELGLKTVPAVIREVSIDSDEAFGIAMTENSDESRTELSALDQAHAFQRLLDSGKSEKEVASICSYCPAHVRNTVKLNLVHKSVRERVAAGTIGKKAAIATLDIPESVRDAVVSKMGVGVTEQEVIKLANEAKREAKASGAVSEDTSKKSNHNRPMGQTSGEKVLPRKTREVREVIQAIAVDMLNAAEDNENDVEAAKANQLAALTWAMGMIPEMDTTSNEFKAVVDDIRSRLEVVEDDETSEAEDSDKEEETEKEDATADAEEEDGDKEEAAPVKKGKKKGKSKAPVEDDEDA